MQFEIEVRLELANPENSFNLHKTILNKSFDPRYFFFSSFDKRSVTEYQSIPLALFKLVN